ncbi:MAG: hypothetical protein WA964_03535 [Ilumatobacter sp.]|uniref:hypothetical protein n=1 Tax=Ilumatobacter sp. TaxID=1967498 RepID=UPI003C795B15
MKPFVRAAFAAAVVLAANGCGQADTTSTTSETGPTTPPTEEAATPDGVVTSVDQLADGFWQPVRASGADVDLTEGDYWEFLTRNDQLLVIGFDGCNGFGSSSGPNGAPTAIEDGRLVNVEVASEAMACDAVAYGPYPEDGDILTLTDNGSRLEVSDSTGTRIELIRLDEIPTRRLGETPTSGVSGTNPPITDPPRQAGTAVSTAPIDLAGATVPCVGESETASLDYAEGTPGAATIEEAVDDWTFEGGAPYLRAELVSVVHAETGRAALVDVDGNLRILLTVSESDNGWLVETSQRCLDP